MSKSGKAALKGAKQKREAGGFVALPFTLLRSSEFAALTPHGVKLLLDLLGQYNLRNNGDLSMSFEKTMRPRGWKSKDTLNKARQELVDAGFILLTRQGGLHRCSLYAVTFYSIDDCDGKLEVSATRAPPSGWRKNTASSTPIVPMSHPLSTPVVP